MKGLTGVAVGMENCRSCRTTSCWVMWAGGCLLPPKLLTQPQTSLKEDPFEAPEQVHGPMDQTQQVASSPAPSLCGRCCSLCCVEAARFSWPDVGIPREVQDAFPCTASLTTLNHHSCMLYIILFTYWLEVSRLQKCARCVRNHMPAVI